tara:strand:- start:922 stop:1119 length:198 start_codon:yes stop_codon:yes gene_type:complete
MKVADSFSEEVYGYILSQYGENMLTRVQSGQNKDTVNKLLESSARNSDDIEHTANKIIAMLRINP